MWFWNGVGDPVGSSGPGSKTGRVTVLCSWTKHFTFTVTLSTQGYRWVWADYQGSLMKCWGNLVMTGIASNGVMIILVASCYANRDKLRLDYPLVSSTDFNLWNGSCVLENLLNGAHNYPAHTGDKWVTKPVTVLRSVHLLWRNSISFIARSMF